MCSRVLCGRCNTCGAHCAHTKVWPIVCCHMCGCVNVWHVCSCARPRGARHVASTAHTRKFGPSCGVARMRACATPPPPENPSNADACVGHPARRQVFVRIAESSWKRKRCLYLKQDDSAAWYPPAHFFSANVTAGEALDSVAAVSTPRRSPRRAIFNDVLRAAPTPPTPRHFD